MDNSPNASTDYISDGFGTWGARSLTPSPSTGLKLSDPLICFVGTAFATPTPLFFSTGECEVLFHDDVKVYEEFTRIEGNTTKLHLAANAVHDISM